MRFAILLPLLFCTVAFAQEDRAAATLKVWDTNGDGVLTTDEFSDKATFKKADRDGDGMVTRDEVAIFLGLMKPPAESKKNGDANTKAAPKKKTTPKKAETKTEAAMARKPFTVSERVRNFFKRFDANKDKQVERKEALGIGNDMWKRFDRNKDGAFGIREATRYIRYTLNEAKKRPNRANFFDLFDRNRDKRVTRKEYDGPTSFFKSYDHNRNKVVTLEELNMGPNAAKASTRQMEADKKFLADGPTKAPKTGMLARYDKDEDGRITLEELGGAEALMSRLDRNGDGVLSGREVK